MKIILGICILFGCVTCYAQPFSPDEKIKPTELKLTEYAGSNPKEKGKIGLVSVTQKDETLYFFVRGISIFSPVMVYVESADKTKRLAVSLHKDLWKDVERSGSTGEDGVYRSGFKTGSEFGIKVNSKAIPAKYQLMVWVGDEVVPNLPSPFKKQKPAK
ncbi:MAG: hypothetical protein ABL959_05045 [Pyrinomonadaceae bacterium]